MTATSRRQLEDGYLALDVAADAVSGVAAPITYTVNGKQYVTVEVGGRVTTTYTPVRLLDPRRVRGDYVYTFALS